MTMHSRGGFVAITSAVIISMLLLAVTLSLSVTGFFARSNVLEMAYKDKSASLAEACIGTALLKLAADRTYAGNEAVSVGAQTCRILPVTQSGGQITVRTTASFPQSGPTRTVTNFVVVTKSIDMSVLSWEEVPNHP